MTETYNIYEAKTHLSELAEKASAGQEIFIAKAGKRLCRLVPLGKPKRVPGLGRDKVWIAPDAFSPEVDEAIAKTFYGSLFPPKRKKRK